MIPCCCVFSAQHEKDNGEWRKLQMLIVQLRKCCNHPYLFPGAEPFFDGVNTGATLFKTRSAYSTYWGWHGLAGVYMKWQVDPQTQGLHMQTHIVSARARPGSLMS
jgi:hypothetical protein